MAPKPGLRVAARCLVEQRYVFEWSLVEAVVVLGARGLLGLSLDVGVSPGRATPPLSTENLHGNSPISKLALGEKTLQRGAHAVRT